MIYLSFTIKEPSFSVNDLYIQIWRCAWIKWLNKYFKLIEATLTIVVLGNYN